MDDASPKAQPPRQANTNVVLLAPELIASPPDQALLLATFRRWKEKSGSAAGMPC